MKALYILQILKIFGKLIVFVKSKFTFLRVFFFLSVRYKATFVNVIALKKDNFITVVNANVNKL